MQGRRSDAEDGRRRLDRHQLALGVRGARLEARDIPMPAQIADAARLEAMAICRGSPLAIEDAGDHGVGIMDRQSADERDRVLVGAYRGRPRARQRQIDLIDRTAFPAQREARRGLVALDLDDDLFEQCPQQLLPVTRRGRCGVPNGSQIGSEREQTVALVLGERPGRASSRRASSVFAASSALRLSSHSRSSPRATSRLSGSTAR